ncbi:hypothetical protein [Anaeromassilibacillus sp. SJQ-1]|uniref:hypothetical protein n=1 Tax=Anaeromassilibacillus sp. SJQ-1 TaxID=3375419 RepID=UPI00398913B4
MKIYPNEELNNACYNSSCCPPPCCRLHPVVYLFHVRNLGQQARLERPGQPANVVPSDRQDHKEFRAFKALKVPAALQGRLGHRAYKECRA